MEVPDVAEELYGLEPGEFVAARDALARRLRSEGDRELAATVKQLRRPSVTAAAMNGAARAHPELLDAALAAADRLRQATEAAVGGDAGDLRAASAEERAAAKAFLEVAEARLSDRGVSEQRLAGTLRAAALDPELREALRRGVLATDHEAPGFGFGAALGLGDVAVAPTPEPVRRPGRRGSSKRDGTDAETKAAREAEERAAAEAAREAAARRRDLEKRIAKLERSAARLAAKADAAEDAARDARAHADHAAADLDAARSELHEA